MMESSSRPGALRLVYAGTPDFAVPSLQRLIDANAQVVAVYTQPDRPAGRGRRLTASPVKALAQAHDIPVLQPPTFKEEESLTALTELKPDLMIVAAYGLILPQRVLDVPTLGCWNLHASLLPRWRGAAPIQRAIEAGDTRTGVCVMHMEAGLDTGPVYLQRSTVIEPEDTGGALHDRLAVLAADALMEGLAMQERGTLPEPQTQEHGQAAYAPKLSKAEAELDWGLPARQLERQVRAFNPWPVSWFYFEGRRLRVWNATADPRPHDTHPGAIVTRSAETLVMATGEGGLRLLEVQPEGGRRMKVGDFLNARQHL